MRKRYLYLRQIRTPMFRYGFAVVMVVASVAWRFAMTPLIGPGYQYVTVYPLIIVVALLAGRGPAIVHAVLAGVLSSYFFSDFISLPAELVTLIVVLSGALAGDMAQRLHNALNQAQSRSEDLAQRESLIRSITENTDALISALDNDFRFIFLNEAYRRGWRQMWQQEIDVGTNLLEVTSSWPREQQKGHALWNRALKGESFRVTISFGPSEKQKRLFDISFNPIYDAKGSQVGAAQVMRDVTEQAGIQQAVSESELFYRQMLESIPGLVFTTRPDGYCDYINHQWVEYTGVGLQDLLGNGWSSLLHPDDRNPVLKAWRAALEELASYDLEYRVRRYDGLYEWFKVRARPIRDASGTIVRWFGVVTNVNDLKAVEEALRDSESRFRGIFENAAAGITLVDLDGNWLDVNETFCKMVGYTKKALLGTSFLILTLPEDARDDLRRYEALKRGLLDSYSVEKRYRHKDGHILWADLYRAIQRDETGNPLYSIAVITDITERKTAEESLRQSEQRLRKIFEIETIGILFFDHHGNFLNANDAFLRMIGFDRRALDGGKLSSEVVTLPEHMPRTEQAFRQLQETGRLSPYEKELIRPDGSRWWGLFAGTRLDDNESMEFVIDVTDQKRVEQALRQSEEQFHGMFDRHCAVKLLVDPETGNICDANEAAVRFYGYSRQQLCAMRIQDINQLSADEIAAERQRAAAEERNYFIFPHRLADGTMRTVEVYSTPVPIHGTFRLYSIIHDITDRRKAEEALRRSERQFRELADSMPQIVWAARPDGVIDYFNRKWKEVTTGNLDRIGDDGWIPALHPDDVERVKDLWYQSIRTGEPYCTELRLNVPNCRQARWHIARALPIRDEQGDIIRWFGTATDVHDLKQLQQSLEASERRYRTLFESIDEGFCIVEMIFDAQQNPVDYRFLEVNPAFERQTGLHAAPGQTMRALVPAHEAHWYEIYGQVALTGRPTRFVNEAKELNRWFDVYAFRVGTPQEHKVAILFSDVTRFKRTEQDLLQYRDRLESKNREMESIIGIVSHDLRAPLVNIQGFSHEIQADCKTLDTMLERVAVEEKVERQLDKLLHHNIPESLQYVQTSAEAMNKLVVTLVEVARAGLSPTRPERLDMNELVADIISNLKIKFEQADVSYALESLPDCYADRTQAAQIFTNLLDNAVKYLHPERRGAICIEGSPQADGVVYSVSDNGIGISQEEQAKIFEPYYQLREKAAGGVGMGLATVKKLVERNNGKIWVVSEKGRYSVFYVALPAALRPG